MKRALLPFALVVISAVSINAQDNLKWGAMVGMNVGRCTITGFDNRVGFHASVRTELGLSQDANGSGAYMDFAILLTLKGAKVDGESLASIKFNPHYLEVSIHVGYKYAINDDFPLFGSVGPYVTVELLGKTKLKVDGDIADIAELGGNSMSEDILGDDGLERFGFGFGLKVGAELSKKYQVATSYDFGLIEVIREVGMKNRNLMISLGYMF